MKYSIFILLLLCTTFLAFGQEEEKKVEFRLNSDSRRTIINRKSVGIFGLRAGLLFNKKFETGVGIYSSSLFGILGKDVEKTYTDFSLTPPQEFPARVHFQYLSLYGEYILIENKGLMLTTNSQIGVGRVNILLEEGLDMERMLRAGKTLVEHSFKAKVRTFSWLHLIGGLGYRYLLNGEAQIKKTFNAPVYILGASIDFKKLKKAVKKGPT